MTCTDFGVSSSGAVNFVCADSGTSYGLSAVPVTLTGANIVGVPEVACANEVDGKKVPEDASANASDEPSSVWDDKFLIANSFSVRIIILTLMIMIPISIINQNITIGKTFGAVCIKNAQKPPLRAAYKTIKLLFHGLEPIPKSLALAEPGGQAVADVVGVAGTRIAKLNTLLSAAIATPQFQAALKSAGMIASPGSPADLQSYVDKDTQKWDELIQKAGLSVTN